MIITCKKRVPNLWIFVAILPWSAVMFKWLAMGTAFTFSLKKFVDNPAGLTFVMSLPAVMSLILSPFCNFMSDRVWTRFGRRKPFVVASWIGTIGFITLMPLAPDFWTLLAIYLLFSAFNDIGGGPMETLKQEIVPPKQRGLSAACGTWLSNFANLTFMFVAIGRFDDYKFMAGLPVTGEQSIYWSLAAAMTIMILVIMFGVKELDPKSHVRGQKFSIRNFFGAILNRDLWPVYTLIFGSAMMNAGLGVMGILLYTEQWQFTKQEMGVNIAIGGAMNMVFITILGVFANKLPRMKTYQILMGLSLFINFCYYIYVNFVLYDQRPTLVELIVFGETLSVIGILVAMVYIPLVYDYVPRNEMGTYAAGSSILNKIVGTITLNGVGLFVWAYSSLFLPPGGEMVRVGLASPATVAEVQTRLVGLEGSDQLTVRSWYATGAVLDHGRAFEIRRANPASVSLREQRDKLEEKRSKLASQEKNEIVFAEDAVRHGDSRSKDSHLAKAAALRAQVEPMEKEIAAMDAQLAERAQAFSSRVRVVIGDRMVAEGGAVRSASLVPGIIAAFPLAYRLPSKEVEKALDRMRLAMPEVADLRVVKSGSGFVAEVSAECLSGMSQAALVGRLTEAFRIALRAKSAVIGSSPVPTIRPVEFLALDADIVEDPLDRHISPITRVVNGILAKFTDVAPPERRVFGMARGMRGSFEHVSVRPLSPDEFAIRILALPSTSAAATSQTAFNFPLASKISPERAADFQTLLARAIEIGPQQRITPVQPVITSSFAKMQYDYMSGYIWMLVLGIIGLGITIAFSRREAKGLIHKRGLEESEATVDVDFRADAVEIVSGDTYTPGYLLPKLGIVALGLLMTGFASINLVPALSLLALGERSQAEAIAVFKERTGGESQRLITDAEILAAEEVRDRSFVFWNEYRFRSASGEEVIFRAPAGSQLRPAHMLFDDDGLPTTLTVCYNPSDPQKVLLPTEFSTWFMPGTLALFGLIGAALGSILAWKARRPIPLPHIADA